MIDTITKKPLKVSIGDRGFSAINLPESQLNEVRQLLTNNNVRFSVSDSRISWNGAPETTIIYLKQGTDPASVQAILDGIN